MNASSWRRAADLIAQQTQATQQIQAVAIADSNQLESLLLSSLVADDSSPPQVNYSLVQPLAVSTPRATTTPVGEIQPTDPYCQIIPGMSECLYPTLTVDSLLSTPVSDDGHTLHKQITSESDKYPQEAAERCEVEDNYFDGCHKSTNTSPSQQEDYYLEEDDINIDNASKPTIQESHEQYTGLHHINSSNHQTQLQDDLATIPEEEEEEEDNVDSAEQDTLVFDSKESDEEWFNTAVDTTSHDSAITMGKPVTAAFISNLVQIPTEQVGCLQVTCQLQEFLDQYLPKLTEKAFEHIYQILQVLDKYLVDNPKQHQHCMLPNSEYITLIANAITLGIDLCNFLAIWAVLSILLDTMISDLQYVQCLQQVFNNYYETHTQDAMIKLEQQAMKIQDTMYDSMTKQILIEFQVLLIDLDKVDTYSIKPTYDNDSDTNTGSTKHDQNTKAAPKDIDTQDNVQNARHDNKVTYVKWSTETNQIDKQYLRDYHNMHRQIEDKQNKEYYKAQTQIHNAVMGDTPVKTAHNRQYIDNISAYDSDLQRISKSVCHKLDLGQNSLLGAQQYTTVKAAADIRVQDKDIKVQDKAIKVQDKDIKVQHKDIKVKDKAIKVQDNDIKVQDKAIKVQDKDIKVQDQEDTSKVHMSDDNGQNNREIYRRAEYIIPQLDGTHNASDSSDIDPHDYLDLANIDIIQPNTKGQKKRQKAAEAEIANIHLADVEIIKPSTRGRKLRQKVPDNEVIDMDKIAKDDMLRYTIKQELKDVSHARKLAIEIERKLKENRKLQAEKARQLQIETNLKEKEAKRRALERVKISALIDKHRPHTPNTPDEVNILAIGINADINDKEWTKNAQPPYKKATKASQIKSSHNKGTKPKKDMLDALLGDPIVNIKKNTKKAKATG